MRRWDADENRKNRWEKQKERIGRYMFVGSSSFLVVYLGAVFLELYLRT